MAKATKAEQTEIWKQEVAECHALLKRARVALKKSNEAMAADAAIKPTTKAAITRNAAIINDIPAAL